MSAPLEAVWPVVFINGKDNFTSKKQAVAAALCGWANCEAGISEKPPEKFGEGMVFINKYVGETLTPSNIMDYAKSL